MPFGANTPTMFQTEGDDILFELFVGSHEFDRITTDSILEDVLSLMDESGWRSHEHVLFGWYLDMYKDRKDQSNSDTKKRGEIA